MEEFRKLLNEFKKGILTERYWIVTVDIKDVWSRWSEIFEGEYSDEDFTSFKKELIEKLNNYTKKINQKLGKDAAIEYGNCIKELNTTNNVDDFDDAWENLNDFSDLYSVFLSTF